MNIRENLKLIPILLLLHSVELVICRPQSFFGVSPFSWSRNDNSVSGNSLREKIQQPISTALKAIGNQFSKKTQAPVEPDQNKQIVFPNQNDDSYRSTPQVQSRINNQKPSKDVEENETAKSINFKNQPAINELLNEPDNEVIDENSITTTEIDISTTEDYETTTWDDFDLLNRSGVNGHVVASLLGK